MARRLVPLQEIFRMATVNGAQVPVDQRVDHVRVRLLCGSAALRLIGGFTLMALSAQNPRWSTGTDVPP